MNNDGHGTIIGYFLYFWMFQIAAFIVLRFMRIIGDNTSWKVYLVFFIIFGLAYTGFYFIKLSGDRKRAARKANAQYEVRNGQVQHKKKKKKKK